MKKAFILSFLFILSFNLQAQLHNGSIIVGEDKAVSTPFFSVCLSKAEIISALWTPDSPFASIGKRFAITQLRISPKPFVFVMTEFRNSIASPFIWNIYS